MEPNKRVSRARKSSFSLVTPNPKPQDGPINRNLWIEEICNRFVSPSLSNREYYRVILEVLWPENHGIPGPHVSEIKIRHAIDEYRRSKMEDITQYKAYVDVFRRVRELQGEEGVKGIYKEGVNYQLVSLEVEPKRLPRTHLSKVEWNEILKQYNFRCAVCGREETVVLIQQDHKIPRLRGGGDELQNWQPLCNECNNFKSTSCRGCSLDCKVCPWAFPEYYGPLRLANDLVKKVRQYAQHQNLDPELLLNKIVEEFLNNNPIS